jgi:uncharacterized protein DUF6788
MEENRPMARLEDLEERKQRIIELFQTLGDFRRGSLVKRFIACGKPGCCCMGEDHPGHGPKYSLTYKVQSKTKTEYVSAGLAKQVSEQVKEHKRFLALCSQLVEVNEEICRLRADSGESRKKKRRNRE